MTGFHNKLSIGSDFGNCHELLCNGCLVENSSLDCLALKKRVWWLGLGKKGSINGFIECAVTGC